MAGKKSKAPPKRSVGRPTEYKPEYVEQVYKLCLLGARDREVAEFLGVAESTINLWKQEHPEFSESMTAGKAKADAEVAHSLYRRALGYSHPAVKIMQDKGAVIVEPYTEHYPPDTAAASLWLRNRQPDKWRDKIDHELSGKGGGPMQHEHSGELALTPLEVHLEMLSRRK